VKIGEKYVVANKQISASAIPNVVALFKNEFEAKNHVKKHFGGVGLVQLTWEEVAAIIAWKKEGKPEKHYYPEENNEWFENLKKDIVGTPKTDTVDEIPF
jgi:hypothetical protein